MKVHYKLTKAKYGFEILRDLKIKLTPPSELNDLFECLPSISADVNGDDVRNLIKSPNGRRFLYNSELHCPAQPFEVAEQEMQAYPEQTIRMVCERYHLFRKTFKAKDYPEIIGQCLIFCLSDIDIREHLTMWAHYADDHKGLAIGFDTSREFFKNLRHVKYSSRRPPLDFIRLVSSEPDQKQMDNVFFTKSALWENEKELRQIHLCKDSNRQRQHDGGVGYFDQITPDLIYSVTFGQRCEQKVIDAFKAEVSNRPELGHVILERAELEDDRYGLTLCRLSP